MVKVKYDKILGELRENDSSIVYSSITFTFDGNYAPPLANMQATCPVQATGTITGWKLYAENAVASNITFTIYNGASAISGTEKPLLSSQTSNQDVALSTWTTAVTKGDIIKAKVDSNSSGDTKFVLILYMVQS